MTQPPHQGRPCCSSVEMGRWEFHVNGVFPVLSLCWTLFTCHMIDMKTHSPGRQRWAFLSADEETKTLTLSRPKQQRDTACFTVILGLRDCHITPAEFLSLSLLRNDSLCSECLLCVQALSCILYHTVAHRIPTRALYVVLNRILLSLMI